MAKAAAVTAQERTPDKPNIDEQKNKSRPTMTSRYCDDRGAEVLDKRHDPAARPRAVT
jgi:hypothetical protein